MTRVQHAIGIAMIVAGGLFEVVGLLLARGSRRAYRVAEGPRRVLANISGQSYIDLGGTLVNTPPLLTPLMTQQACTAWRVSLEEKDSSGDTTTWPEISSQVKFGDMEILYDGTMTKPRPPTPSAAWRRSPARPSGSM